MFVELMNDFKMPFHYLLKLGFTASSLRVCELSVRILEFSVWG